jgi:hypothetical protein
MPIFVDYLKIFHTLKNLWYLKKGFQQKYEKKVFSTNLEFFRSDENFLKLFFKIHNRRLKLLTKFH